jgi:hypothetical protein
VEQKFHQNDANLPDSHEAEQGACLPLVPRKLQLQYMNDWHRNLLKDVFLLPGWLTRPDGVLRLPGKLFSCMLITATVRWGLGQRRVIRGMGQMQSVG